MPIQNFIYAVGLAGTGQSTIVYSTDGVNWNNLLPDPFAPYAASDIVTNGNIVLAAGFSGSKTVFYSTDGLNFQPVTVHGIEGVTDLFSGGLCSRLFYNNSIFVACGSDNLVGPSTYTLAYSSNGIDWYPSTTGGQIDPFAGGAARDVFFANNLWVAVGSNNSTTELSTCSVASSPNGQVWTPGTIVGDVDPFNGGVGLSVYYGGGKWVIIGMVNSSSIAYSTNGTNWFLSSISLSFTSNSSDHLVYYGTDGSGGNIWNTVGYVLSGENTILRTPSPDLTWNEIITGDPFGGLLYGVASSIYYANGYWVAVGTDREGEEEESVTSTNTIAYSTDGQNWNLVSASNIDPFAGSSGFAHSVTYNSHYSLWIVGGAGPAQLATATSLMGPWTPISQFTDSYFYKIINITFGTNTPVPCFLESSTILTDDGYIPIENIKPGTLVKTIQEGFKRVQYIGSSTIYNPKSADRIQKRLYILRKEKYPELTEDLILTGDHSILVKSLTDTQRELINKNVGRVFVTSNKYRLMAFADEKAEPWIKEGNFKVWHLALENTLDNTNYGIYANGGLLVESAAIKALKDREGVTLIKFI